MAVMADDPFLGEDDGAYGVVQIAAQVAFERYKAAVRNAYVAAWSVTGPTETTWW
jgi:hypothetical protein